MLGFTMDSSSEINHRMADAFLRVSDELRGESERGAIILAFAWIDEELTRALKKFCLPSPHVSEKGDELFGVGRPIGDTATKIDLAFRLGLIRGQTHKSLHILRKLRNDFAHMSSRLTFETDSVRDRVRILFELQQDMTDAILASTRENPNIATLFHAHEGKPSPQVLLAVLGTKTLFHILAATIVSGLMYLTHDVSQVSHTATGQQ